MLGLIELLFILSLAIGWGVYELRALDRERRKKGPGPRASLILTKGPSHRIERVALRRL